MGDSRKYPYHTTDGFKDFRRGAGGVGHGPKGIMGKKSKTAHLHLTFALFTSLVTP